MQAQRWGARRDAALQAVEQHPAATWHAGGLVDREGDLQRTDAAHAGLVVELQRVPVWPAGVDQALPGRAGGVLAGSVAEFLEQEQGLQGAAVVACDASAGAGRQRKADAGKRNALGQRHLRPAAVASPEHDRRGAGVARAVEVLGHPVRRGKRRRRHLP
jgi:hypothetical protein